MTVQGTIRSYRDLKVWNEAMDLAVESYKVTGGFPPTEIYGLVSQIRRAAASVPANVAEGYGRDHRGSYVQYLRIAQGSLKEFETHVILAGRLGFAPADAVERLLETADRIGRMLRGLIRSLKVSQE